MNETTSLSEDRYELVSSLYGPGTTACWYLTIISCLASWTLHPSKRTSGSIDSDFLALLIFPTVAAGHLIFQLIGYPGDNKDMMATQDPELLKLVAAIEAPLNITEIFMPIAVVLFLIAILRRCFKRALFVGTTGLFCLSAEAYMFILTWGRGTTPMNLGRPFLVNFNAVMIFILFAIGFLMTSTLVLIVLFFNRTYQSARAAAIDPDLTLGTQQSLKFLNSIHFQISRMISLVILPITAMASAGGMIGMQVLYAATSWATVDGLIQHLFPQTNVSVKDLDQAVAVLAGATALGFSLYSVADCRYRAWLSRHQAVQEIEMIRLRRRIPYMATPNLRRQQLRRTASV
jgi:hypothetical protein